MRARVKRKQLLRRIEIIAIVAIVAVSLGVGFYLALNQSDPRAAVDGLPVSQSNMAGLVEASQSSYGNPGTTYWQTLTGDGGLSTLSGPAWMLGNKPIFVYVGAEFCPYCAVTRWSIVLALMRFGNFSNLSYMTSAYDDGDFSTLTFYGSNYSSPYLVFQPFETETRASATLQTLPANYSTAFSDQGKSSFPFLNFANEYYISGSLIDPSVLGTLNQTQIIAAMNTPSSTLGSELRQAANIITAMVCKITSGSPGSVCNNSSITALNSLTLAYNVPPSQQSQLLLPSSDSSFAEAYLETGYAGWE